MDKRLTKHFVDSSNIEYISYDEKEEKLYVMFRSGGYYVYSDVPKNIFKEFLEAGSKGRYLAMKIKWNYPYERLN